MFSKDEIYFEDVQILQDLFVSEKIGKDQADIRIPAEECSHDLKFGKVQPASLLVCDVNIVKFACIKPGKTFNILPLYVNYSD